MTTPLSVADVAHYLVGTGWERTTRSWRGARVWARNGFEVLLPTRDDLGDNQARIRDLLRLVAAAEARTLDEVHRDVAHALADTTTCRIGTDDAGLIKLLDGLETVTGLRDLIRAAARTVLEGPHLRFTGRQPAAVDELLERIELARPPDGGVAYTLLIPASAEQNGLRGRDVAVQLHDAAAAAEVAAHDGDVAAFDDAVTAGVSADFCAALSSLAGPDRREPFELGFRWAHALPSAVPPQVVPFLPDAGLRVRAAAARLRRLRISGQATALGAVDGQHDEAGGTDRWRVRLRGELRTGQMAQLAGPRRAVWARLPDQNTYDRALEAYRTGRRLRVDGELTSRDGRVELAVTAGGVETMDNPGPEDERAE